MLVQTRYNKFKPVGIPPINKNKPVSNEMKNPEEALYELLQPLDDLHFETSSNYSDISDMFEDIHKDFLIRTKKDCSKKVIDTMVMDGFTSDFKETVLKTRKDLNVPVSKPYFITAENYFNY